MAKVYVVQEDPRKNIFGAMRWGVLVPVLPEGTRVMLNAGPAIAKVREVLREYTEDDYILAIGDPAAIGIVCAVAAKCTGGYFQMLKWDNVENTYYPVKVDMRPEVIRRAAP